MKHRDDQRGETHSRKGGRKRCQSCQQRRSAHRTQTIVHLSGKERERCRGGGAREGVRRHGGRGYGAVGGDDVGEDGCEAPHDPRAEGHGGKDGYDPVDVRVCGECEPVQAWGDQDRAELTWDQA